MCLCVPARVTKTDGETGVIEVMGVSREVFLGLLRDVVIGDYVLVHAGCAIQKIDGEEARKTIELFKELKETGGIKI